MTDVPESNYRVNLRLDVDGMKNFPVSGLRNKESDSEVVSCLAFGFAVMLVAGLDRLDWRKFGAFSAQQGASCVGSLVRWMGLRLDSRLWECRRRVNRL